MIERPEDHALIGSVVDMPIKPFTDMDSDELGMIFEALDDSPYFMTFIDPSFVIDGGLGFLHDVQDAVLERYKFCHTFNTDAGLMGSPVMMRLLMVVGCNMDVAELGDLFSGQVTVAKNTMPNLLRFAPKAFNLNALAKGSGAGHGFLWAHLYGLPPLASWGDKPLVIEEVHNNNVDYVARRFSIEEVEEILGVTVSNGKIEDLAKVVPFVCYLHVDAWFTEYLKT